MVTKKQPPTQCVESCQRMAHGLACARNSQAVCRPSALRYPPQSAHTISMSIKLSGSHTLSGLRRLSGLRLSYYRWFTSLRFAMRLFVPFYSSLLDDPIWTIAQTAPDFSSC